MLELDVRHRQRRLRNFALGASGFLLPLIAWETVAASGLIRTVFLPSVGDVVRATWDLFVNYDLLSDFRASFLRVTVGYLLAVIIAVPIGVLVGAFGSFRALIEPVNGFVRYTPLPAFIPLIVLWVGIGELNKITIIFLGVFWSLITMVSDVVAETPRTYVETAKTLGVGKWAIVSTVVLPSSLPGIVKALRVAIGWAWSSLILAEVVGANEGLGHMIVESQRFLKTPNVVAGIVLVGLVGLLLDLLLRLVQRPLFPWIERSV